MVHRINRFHCMAAYAAMQSINFFQHKQTMYGDCRTSYSEIAMAHKATHVYIFVQYMCCLTLARFYTPISKTLQETCSVNYSSSAGQWYTILMNCVATYELRDFQVMATLRCHDIMKNMYDS